MSRVVAVAVSGGRDSMALLHVTRAAASGLGVEVVALHVHHGLMPDADRWQEQVLAQCRRWRVPCHTHRLEGRPAAGDSVEAWARRERYAALAQLARSAGASLVLLAHHRRDQAETFLLQALRGAGPAGLAAMPRRFDREGMQWARPWIDQPREAVEAYVRRHRLRFVDDPSNADPRFARSRLRQSVWPALVSAFPDAETTLAAAARRAHDADRALATLAEDDLARVLDGGAFVWSRCADWPAERQANALREWLRRETGRRMPQTLMSRLESELATTSAAQWPLPDGARLERHRGRLRVVPAPTTGANAPIALAIARAGVYRVPQWGGALQVRRVRAGGVALSRLGHCELRPRQGAEQFQAGPARPPRSLKKQFQAAGVPPSDRVAPLLFAGETLLFVPGLGIDARVSAAPGEPQVALTWLSEPTGAP